MAFRNSKIVLTLLQLAAFWSVEQWFVTRLYSANNEFYGFWALAAIGLVSFKLGVPEKARANFWPIVASIAAYAVLFPYLPKLLAAVVVVTSFTLSISGWRFGKRFHFGVWSLFLLALPMVASLQFYFGYPLRVAIGEAAARLLRLNGLDVVREGVCLHFGPKLIWIDAPCSGVRMLWAGFFLAALLATVYKFRFLQTLAAFAAALAVILAGNIFRATGLFYLEAGIVKLPAFAHAAIGVGAFILTAAAIAAAIFKLRSLRFFEPPAERPGNKACAGFPARQIAIFAVACSIAAAVPLFEKPDLTFDPLPANVRFPTVFENRPLAELELTDRERVFQNDFPGEARRFTDGRREIIVRYITGATRRLHPSADCLAAIGYEIAPLPLKIDAEQNKWACFTARRGDENLKVCERIYTDGGESWTDASSWYWSALGRQDKNYWAMTVAETNEEISDQ